MKFTLGIGLIICFISAASSKNIEPVWSATGPEGSCSENGFQIVNQSIEVGKDSTFVFRAFFTSLFGITQVLRGNLEKNEAKLVYGRGDAATRVQSFTAEQVGDTWELRIRFLFAGWSNMFVHSVICETIFQLYQMPPTD